MNRSILVLAPLLLAITQTACSVVPPLAPIERKVAQQAKPTPRVVKITLGELLAKYAPPTFEYDAHSPDVDFSRPVNFDTSLSWSAAFDKALSDAGIDRLSLNAPAPLQQPIPTNEASASQFAGVEVGSVDVPGPAAPAAPAGAAAVERLMATAPAQAATAVDPVPAGPVIQKCVPEAVASGEPMLTWDAPSNTSLKQTLEGWSRTAGWEVAWAYIDEQTNTGTDLTLGGGKKCQGAFKDAVRTLIDSLPESDHVVAEMWSGNSPPLLRVFNKGKENK